MCFRDLRHCIFQFRRLTIRQVLWRSPKAKYIPLPETAYPVVQERFDKLQAGSGFGGVQEVGPSAEELLQRELK